MPAKDGVISDVAPPSLIVPASSLIVTIFVVILGAVLSKVKLADFDCAVVSLVSALVLGEISAISTKPLATVCNFSTSVPLALAIAASSKVTS